MDKFRRDVLKVNKSRKHKVKNSIGVYDVYKAIRRSKWIGIGRSVTEHDFYYIIRQINNLLKSNFINGYDIVFPCKMGTLELRKYSSNITFKDGKLKTNLPIDWDRTLKLWKEDEECYKERTLVKMEEKEIYKVLYNKSKANYENKSFMQFKVNRDLKTQLKYNIKTKKIDAFKL